MALTLYGAGARHRQSRRSPAESNFRYNERVVQGDL
jgi:hypothetical protein